MKAAASVAFALCMLTPAIGCASGGDFNSVVSAVEQRYAVHAQQVPMMGLVSFCAWGFSAGGVKGMHIAEFDHLTLHKGDDLNRLMEEKLGSKWQPFVIDREAKGEQDVIYVQPHGDYMRMFIASYDGNELDLVRMEVNGDRMEHWMRKPATSARSHDYGTKSQQPE